MKRYTQKEIDGWPDEHQGCSLCRRVLPFDYYNKNKNGRWGLDRWCRDCRRQKSAASYASPVVVSKSKSKKGKQRVYHYTRRHRNP